MSVSTLTASMASATLASLPVSRVRKHDQGFARLIVHDFFGRLQHRIVQHRAAAVWLRRSFMLACPRAAAHRSASEKKTSAPEQDR